MNLSGPFIRRPVMTVLVMSAILVFGTMAYRTLPVSDLPNIEQPTLQVTAALPGASPETMASAVATPLERQFTTIDGITSMTSTSTLGSTQITLQFSLERDLDSAAQDVQAAIARVSGQLPRDMPTPPSYRKTNPADEPVLYVALTSPTLPLSQLDEYGQTLLAQRISTVSGVAQVNVFGSQKYAVRIQLDPRALASRGIGIDQVQQAIAAANPKLPSGTLQGPHRAFTLQTTGQLQDAAAFLPIIVAERDGVPVRVRDIGRVIDDVENNRTAAWYVDKEREQRSVILAIQKQPGTNTVEVVKAVRALLPRLEEQLPASVSLNVLYDRSESIEESIHDVKFTLLLTLVLVVLVIFLFLRNLPATIIPSLSLPLSLVGTFAIMSVLGFSLDNLSLMALTLSVGFVVDDAIVMLENIVRHLDMGKTPRQAALDGSAEVGFTIVSMTISLAAVFIPVLFMGGFVGRLFREFAVTVGAAILVSGVVSLTLVPMLGSRFLRKGRTPSHGGEASAGGMLGVLRFYRWSLRLVIARPALTMAFSAAVLAATAWLYSALPKGFLPTQDTGRIMISTEAAQGISFESLVEHQRAAVAIVREDPDVMSLMSSAGARNTTAANGGIIFLRLKPRGERESSAEEVVARLRGKLASVQGLRAFPQLPPPIRIGGQITRAQYQYTLQSPSTDSLYASAPALEARIRELPGFRDVSSDLQLRNPQAVVDIDRDRAAMVGVSPEQIEQALYSAYGSRQVSTIYAPSNQYAVILELDPRFQRDPVALSSLHVRSSSGELVPLGSVAKLRTGVGPLAVNHLGQLSAVTISFNLDPGAAIGDATKLVDDVARETLPSDVTTSFQGQAQAFQESLKGMGLLLLMAILVIYLVLGILYESFIHPITILSALPFAGFGAFLTLMLAGTELSIYAFVGIIMLVGLVKKNGIMMVDFAIERRREGMKAADAIVEACIVRFRPIMMTTVAALMGTLPIALGWGAGAEARRPLGLAVVGGLLFSQMLTLYVTPVVYVLLDSVQERLARRSRPRDAAPLEREAAAGA